MPRHRLLRLVFLAFSVLPVFAPADCWEQLGDMLPIHLGSPARLARDFFDRAKQQDRANNLVTQLRKGKVTSEFTKLVKMSMAEALLTDKQGRVYLIEERVSGNIVTDEMGRTTTISEAALKKLLEPVQKEPTERRTHADQDRETEILGARFRHERDVHQLKETLKFGGKLLYYPYALAWRAIRHMVSKGHIDGQKILRHRPVWYVRDGVAAMGYLFLVGTGTHPTIYFAPIAENASSEEERNAETILLDSFLAETNQELGSPPEGATLFLDGTSKGDRLHDTMKLIFDRLYSRNPNARYRRVKDATEIEAAIRSVVAETGMLIADLEVGAHGLTIKPNDAALPSIAVIEMGTDFLTADMETFHRLNNRQPPLATLTSRVTDEERMFTQRKPYAISDLPDLTDLFVPRAHVRFISCEAGADTCGDKLMDSLATKTVRKHGGRLAMATRRIGIPYAQVDLETQEAMRRDVEERLKRYREMEKYQSLWGDLWRHAGYQAKHATDLPPETLITLYKNAEKLFGEGKVKVKDFKPEAEKSQR